jgi:hypothetical protein
LPSPLPPKSVETIKIKKKKVKAIITYVTTSGDDSASNAPQIITVTQRIKVKKNKNPPVIVNANSPVNSNANSI